MMKIGCITWWRNNYGSILQAYALQQTIEQYTNNQYEIINQYSKKAASIENLMIKLKTIGIKKTIKRVFFRFSFSGLRKRVENIQQFIDNNLKVSKQVYDYEDIIKANEKYDTFICGSDQIWNPENVQITDKLYWLEFADPSKLKVSYAPSIGVVDACEKDKQIIKDHLQTFTAISCREQSGTDFINKVIGSDKCCTVLDPTLLLEPEIWAKTANSRIIQSDYIFAYMLRGTKKDRKLIENIAKETRLPIIIIPFLDPEHPVFYDLRFGDIKKWDASPQDFISLIKNAKYIFTDSFHCMIFSILFHRTFFTFRKLGQLQMERIYGLQKLLCTGDRMIDCSMKPSDVLQKPDIDWKEVDYVREHNRKTSLQYLLTALQEKLLTGKE